MKRPIGFGCISQVSFNVKSTNYRMMTQNRCVESNLVNGTQILMDGINEADSGLIETNFETFSRLTAKLNIDWKKVKPHFK